MSEEISILAFKAKTASLIKTLGVAGHTMKSLAWLALCIDSFIISRRTDVTEGGVRKVETVGKGHLTLP